MYTQDNHEGLIRGHKSLTLQWKATFCRETTTDMWRLRHPAHTRSRQAAGSQITCETWQENALTSVFAWLWARGDHQHLLSWRLRSHTCRELSSAHRSRWKDKEFRLGLTYCGSNKLTIGNSIDESAVSIITSREQQRKAWRRKRRRRSWRRIITCKWRESEIINMF